MAKNDAEDSELAVIKKLLILGLLRSGLTQTQIAAALGMHQTSLSRMFPKGALAAIKVSPAAYSEPQGDE